MRTSAVYTRHLKPICRNFRVWPADLTAQSFSYVFAYNGYLGVTVRQHYYAHHRLRLRHPYMPCVIAYGGKNHRSFYPLEVLGIRFD